eukprot:360892-Chlamydomonas_euryale.AAC.2
MAAAVAVAQVAAVAAAVAASIAAAFRAAVVVAAAVLAHAAVLARAIAARRKQRHDEPPHAPQRWRVRIGRAGGGLHESPDTSTHFCKRCTCARCVGQVAQRIAQRAIECPDQRGRKRAAATAATAGARRSRCHRRGRRVASVFALPQQRRQRGAAAAQQREQRHKRRRRVHRGPLPSTASESLGFTAVAAHAAAAGAAASVAHSVCGQRASQLQPLQG